MIPAEKDSTMEILEVSPPKSRQPKKSKPNSHGTQASYYTLRKSYKSKANLWVTTSVNGTPD